VVQARLPSRGLMNRLRLLAACAGAAFALPAAVSFVPTVAAAAPAPEVDRAVAALRAIATMRADFVQTDRSGQSVTGTMTLKRPGRVRFQYEKSANMLIVSDGKALTVIDYDVAQVQRWPIRNSPLGALLDPARDMASYAKLLPAPSPSIVSIEVRDPRHPEYGVITLIFVRRASAPGGMELASWVALDSQNKRTTVTLSNQRYGIPVSDDTFRWRDPRPTVHR
jgi:outer membrane lipoprotein-sorting protein